MTRLVLPSAFGAAATALLRLPPSAWADEAQIARGRYLVVIAPAVRIVIPPAPWSAPPT